MMLREEVPRLDPNRPRMGLVEERGRPFALGLIYINGTNFRLCILSSGEITGTVQESLNY